MKIIFVYRIFVYTGVNRSGIHRCPVGFYCPNGTGNNWKPCPTGTYGPQDGLSTKRDCKACDAGKYCDQLNSTSVSGDCSPGYYCVSGVDIPTPQFTNLTNCPDGTVHMSVGGKCPAGSYCELSSQTYTACPAGKYTPNSGFSACDPCPAGYYCLNETSDYTSYRCPVGHFCPSGTSDPYQFPCPPGTYNPNELASNLTSCLDCTAGKYCEGSGNSAPTNSCAAGYYCPGKIDNPKPAQHKCEVRHYCPVESPSMVVCTAGSYCETEGLDKPTGICDQGFYCPNGSLVSTEKICPPGRYCPIGSDTPELCPIGKFLPGTGAFSEQDCTNCTGGYYCNSTGLDLVSGACAQGYYCPPGQQTWKPSGYQCPKGHYCLEGTLLPTRCENGTYQDEDAQWKCKTCQTGYFCDNTLSAVDTLAGRECPMGHYCPEGTKYNNEFPCLSGTWTNQTGLNASEKCDPCPPK